MQVIHTKPWLVGNPKSPKIENPTEDEQAQLDGYWKGVMNMIDFVIELQNEIPGWLPEFKLMKLD